LYPETGSNLLRLTNQKFKPIKKTNMKRSILLTMAMCAMVIAAKAQIKYYKIEKGVKTELKNGENVDLAVDGESKVQTNLLVEIDIKDFRAKNNHDNMVVQWMDKRLNSDARNERSFVHITFDDPFIQKKYAGVNVLKVYLFKTDDNANDPKALFLEKSSTINLYYLDYTYQLKVSGRYIQKVEEYYEDKTWKKRNVYSALEPISASGELIFKYAKEALAGEQYKQLVDPGKEEKDGVKGLDRIKDVFSNEVYVIKREKINVPVVGSVEAYKEIPKALETIWVAKSQQILDEKDKQKAIDMLLQLNKDYKVCMVSELDKSVLKSINKELKGLSTADEMYAVFKKNNPK
jgi:hypothetical protein